MRKFRTFLKWLLQANVFYFLLDKTLTVTQWRPEVLTFADRCHRAVAWALGLPVRLILEIFGLSLLLLGLVRARAWWPRVQRWRSRNDVTIQLTGQTAKSTAGTLSPSATPPNSGSVVITPPSASLGLTLGLKAQPTLISTPPPGTRNNELMAGGPPAWLL